MPPVLTPMLHYTEPRQQQQQGKLQWLQRTRRPANTPTLTKVPLFMPVALETLVPFDSKWLALCWEGGFSKKLERRCMATSYLMQHLSLHGDSEGKRGCSVGVIRLRMQQGLTFVHLSRSVINNFLWFLAIVRSIVVNLDWLYMTYFEIITYPVPQ